MIHLAALIALATSAVAAQPTSVPVQLQPAPDSADRREALRGLVSCVAKARPRWARQTLALPYLSDAQAGSAAEVLNGRDSCQTNPEVHMTFRTSTLVGTLAEHFIQTQLDPDAIARLQSSLNTAAPLNASEDFALCVAARNPNAARDLALSALGSEAEAQSAKLLVNQVPQCTRPEETMTVDLQALRALTATALYRAITRAASSH